jgi:hypothetical protein
VQEHSAEDRKFELAALDRFCGRWPLQSEKSLSQSGVTGRRLRGRLHFVFFTEIPNPRSLRVREPYSFNAFFWREFFWRQGEDSPQRAGI